MTDDEQTDDDLRARVESLEEQVESLLPSRREFLKLSAAGLGGGALALSSTPSSAQTPAGQIGEPNTPVDIYANNIGDSSNPVDNIYADSQSFNSITVNGTGTFDGLDVNGTGAFDGLDVNGGPTFSSLDVNGTGTFDGADVSGTASFGDVSIGNLNGQVALSTNQTISHQTTTPVEYDDVRLDEHSEWNSSSYVIEPHQDGTIWITAAVAWAASSNWSTGDELRIQVELNGIPNRTVWSRKVGTGLQSETVPMTGFNVTTSDQIGIAVNHEQSGGGSADLSDGFASTWLSWMVV